MVIVGDLMENKEMHIVNLQYLVYSLSLSTYILYEIIKSTKFKAFLL